MRSSVRSVTGESYATRPGFQGPTAVRETPQNPRGSGVFDAPVSLSPHGAIRGNGGASTRTDTSAFRATASFPGSRRLTARDRRNDRKAPDGASPRAFEGRGEAT